MEFSLKVNQYEVATIDDTNGDGVWVKCGVLPASDVRRMLRGYKYDPAYDMYFTLKATKAIELKRAPESWMRL